MNGGFDLNGDAKRLTVQIGKEYVVNCMSDRQRTRMRERGEPLPSDQRRRRHTNGCVREGGDLKVGDNAQAQSTLGCVIM
jgi:hypothetical protein